MQKPYRPDEKEQFQNWHWSAVLESYVSLALTNVVLLLNLMQGDVLPNKDTDANAAHVEAIQKLMDLR